MRAHILILSFVGYCVAVFDRPRPRAERPISNVQFNDRLQVAAPPAAAADTRTVEWLQRALQRYLGGHDHLAPYHRDQPQLNAIWIEKTDGDDDSQEESDEEEERSAAVGVLPMWPFVDRPTIVPSDQFKTIADKLLEARQLADDSQSRELDSLQNGEHDSLHSSRGPLLLQSHKLTRNPKQSHAAAIADYVRALLLEQARGDDSRQSHDKLQQRAPDSLHANDLDSHMRVVPPAIQQRIELQAHARGDHECALLRPHSRGDTPPSPPSPQNKIRPPKPSSGGLQLFGPVMDGRRQRHVLHEEYPGMMNYYTKYVHSMRQKKFIDRMDVVNEE